MRADNPVGYGPGYCRADGLSAPAISTYRYATPAVCARLGKDKALWA